MSASGLKRDLGVLGLVATGVGSMVGAGINIVPFALQRSVPVGPHTLSAYALAAVPAVLAALCYAMLASAMPRAGGSYVYVSRSLGAYAGFVASFSQWVGLCIAIGVVSYVIAPFLRDTAAAAGWLGVAGWLDRGPVRLLIALGALWGAWGLNRLGVKAVASALVPLMVLTFACGGLVIWAGATHDHAAYAAVVPAALGVTAEARPLSAVMLPAAAVLFSSFIGFDAIAQAGGEARDPSRTLPLAIGLAIGVVGAFYLAFTWAVHHAVPWPYLAQEAARRDVSAPGLLAPLVSRPVAVLMVAGAAIALIKDLPGMLLGVSRLCFAWASDGIMPRGLLRVHPVRGTPDAALLLSAGLATAGILGNHFAGDFFLGVEILVTAMLVNFLAVAVAVLALPRTNPALDADVAVVRHRGVRRALAAAAFAVLLVFAVQHTRRDLASGAAWYAQSTPTWLLVMAIGTVVYAREVRALARRGGDLAAITRVLPPE
ncbi:MAG: APC family permease [Gemmatimonadota bacterium]